MGAISPYISLYLPISPYISRYLERGWFGSWVRGVQCVYPIAACWRAATMDECCRRISIPAVAWLGLGSGSGLGLGFGLGLSASAVGSQYPPSPA